MNSLRRFVFLILPAACIALSAVEGGEFVREQQLGSLIFDPNPAPGEVGYWSGSKDSDGYASGFGVLIWFKDGVQVSAYEGEKVRGKWTSYRKLAVDEWPQQKTENNSGKVGDSDSTESSEYFPVIVPDQPFLERLRHGRQYPRMIELPEFLAGAAKYVYYSSCRETVGRARNANEGGARLNFFIDIEESQNNHFMNVLLSPQPLISRGWESHAGDWAYARWGLPSGVTNDEIISFCAYFGMDGSIDYTRPMRISFRRNGSSRIFEGYCDHLGPNGKGTLGSGLSNRDLEGRVFGEFKGDKLVAPCSFSEFATAATLQSSKDNNRLAAQQKEFFALAGAAAVVTLGIYDVVGTKLGELAAKGRALDGANGSRYKATDPARSGTGSITKTFTVTSDARANQTGDEAGAGGESTVTVRDDDGTYVVNYSYNWPSSYLISAGRGKTLEGRSVSIQFDGERATYISCGAGSGKCRINSFSRR